MSKIKSFSVGNGDMFYIQHGSSNLTIIDVNLSGDNSDDILEEIKNIKDQKKITRFISTHPDQDHISGLRELDEHINILNFYCVKNNTKKDTETIDFNHYCELKDSEKVFCLYKGCSRKWMNADDGDTCNIGAAGISILWPDLDNTFFHDALIQASEGQSPNNISPIVKYSLTNSAVVLWMGDLETDFMENITNDVEIPEVDILFAPHHGRQSGKIPEKWLEKMDPKLIIIGEAPSDALNYYSGYNTITQNSAGNITFYLKRGVVNIFSSNENYSVSFLTDNQLESDEYEEHYLGTIEL